LRVFKNKFLKKTFRFGLKEVLYRVQTGSKTRPAVYQMGSGCPFSGDKSARALS
jgi:hypothetical protein